MTGEPLDPSQLVALHYSRNTNGELNDPVTFKVFSEHSHIVAIAATGNVFLADTVKQFAASGKDLVSDQDFTKSVGLFDLVSPLLLKTIDRDDLVTLQDPHGLGPPRKPTEPVASSSKTPIVRIGLLSTKAHDSLHF